MTSVLYPLVLFYQVDRNPPSCISTVGVGQNGRLVEGTEAPSHVSMQGRARSGLVTKWRVFGVVTLSVMAWSSHGWVQWFCGRPHQF